MVYKKLPKKYNAKQLAKMVKNRVLFSNDVPADIVRRIADEMGLSKKTIYDYLSGRIRPDLDFLHALVVASDGDPVLKKILEPNGWILKRATVPTPSGKSISADILCLHPDLTRFETLLTEPIPDSAGNQLARIEAQLEFVEKGLRRAVENWKAEHMGVCNECSKTSG
jgi:transcriptional regulator with XRE-family HTH domain